MPDPANPSTHASLLDALRSGRESEAWPLFCSRYGGVIAGWCRKWGTSPEDAEDVAQETLLTVFRQISEFRYDPSQSFRGWLKTVSARIRQRMRERQHRRGHGQQLDGQVEEQAALEEYTSLLDTIADQELFHLAAERTRRRVNGLMWASYERVDLIHQPRPEAARELGISEDYLRVNISRVRRMIQDEVRALDPN